MLLISLYGDARWKLLIENPERFSPFPKSSVIVSMYTLRKNVIVSMYTLRKNVIVSMYTLRKNVIVSMYTLRKNDC